MLEDHKLISISESVYRLANAKQRLEALKALLPDELDIQETLEFLGEEQESDAESLVASVFNLRPGKNSWPIGRFGNGSYPVFYSSLDLFTAQSEITYFAEKHRLKSPFFYHQVQCRLSAQGHDLRPFAELVTALAGPDSVSCWPECQRIATEAIQSGAQALLTLSARRQEGTNAPVFER